MLAPMNEVENMIYSQYGDMVDLTASIKKWLCTAVFNAHSLLLRNFAGSTVFPLLFLPMDSKHHFEHMTLTSANANLTTQEI